MDFRFCIFTPLLPNPGLVVYTQKAFRTLLVYTRSGFWMLMKKPGLQLLIANLILVAVILLTYLPALSQATIYRDDWYYTVDRLKGGPETFHKMFEIDRPARGYFFEAYYQLFGVNPAPYHWVALAFRIILVLAAFWLFRLLWPENMEAAFVMSLLFVIYPGYTRWMEGFEDQPKIVSLCLQVFSIAFTLKAIEASKLLSKTILWTLSILTGLGYILLIDYAIGMEVFRLLCVYIIVNRNQGEQSLRQKGWNAIKAWLPALLIPGIFLFWRLLLFDNQRPATDLGLQLGTILQSPLKGGWTWLLALFRSVINQAVLAWWAPYFQGFFEQNNREIFIGLLVACIASAMTVGYLAWRKKDTGDNEKIKIAIWVGLAGVVAGLLPVIVANRQVMFGAFSHYALPASLAAATLLGGIIYSISSRTIRWALVSVLVLLAVMNHISASARVLNEEKVISNFWYQVSWRAPDIKEGTTLNVSYPGINYGEDYDAVHGPANFIYYPEPDATIPVTYPLYGISQYAWTSKEILSGYAYDTDYRTHVGVVDPGDMLVISQPAEYACVHIINPKYAWYSYNDPDFILLTGSLSKIENVQTDGESPRLVPGIFGPEPAHDWCYFFEKADLAAQNDDWDTILKLVEEVKAKTLHPNERLEWMPFLQAYAVSGNAADFSDTMAKITSVTGSATLASYDAPKVNGFNRKQACNVLTSMNNVGYEFSPEIQELIDTLVCR